MNPSLLSTWCTCYLLPCPRKLGFVHATWNKNIYKKSSWSHLDVCPTITLTLQKRSLLLKHLSKISDSWTFFYSWLVADVREKLPQHGPAWEATKIQNRFEALTCKAHQWPNRNYLGGGWTNPFEKYYISQIEPFPQGSGWKIKYLKPPPNYGQFIRFILQVIQVVTFGYPYTLSP